MTTVFVIKGLQKGVWYYWHDYEPRPWDEDLYFSKQFANYPEAEAYLKDKCEKEHWGGFFQIEKVFVNR